MKLCIFSALFLPHLGGVERFSYNMAKKLISKGHEVIIVTSDLDSGKYYEKIEEIKIYRLVCWKLLDGRFPVVRYNKRNREIFKRIKMEKIDGVIVNTRFYVHSYFGVSMAKNLKLPCIVIEHGTSHFTVNSKFFDMAGRIYEHFISWMIKRKCSNFYGVSLACNEWLKHFHIQSKGVVYNAIDIDEIQRLQKDSKVDYRKDYNVQDDEIIITFTGRLVREKGIHKLLDAYQKIYSENQKVHLFVAGDGGLINDLKIYDEKRHIHILGKIDFSRVIALLRSSEIFCLPTDYPEGFPTSVLEAAACKCFIITTKMGGSKEIITSRDYGIILEENSVEGIYTELRELLKNKKRMKDTANRCYDRLIHNFTWDKTVEKIIDIFQAF